MICHHISIKEKRPGQEGNCSICNLPIIYATDGKWTWLYGISEKERKALKTVFNVDTLMGK